MKFFHNLSSNTAFPVCLNLLPHFAARKHDYHDFIGFVSAALQDGRSKTFFLADRPAGKQDFSTLQLARDVLAEGGELIVSLSLSFYDRKSLVNRLHRYLEAGIKQFVFVSGDYPAAHASKAKKPVFDLDSVQLLMLLDEVLQGTEVARGCVVNPFKYFESELIWQYEKLRRKVKAGADFVISQIGFDLRKYDELLRYSTQHDIDAPLVANIFAADLEFARLVQARAIPGVKIPGQLIRLLHEEKPDRRPLVTRTAGILAAIQGLGYHGAMLGSSAVDFSETKQILNETEKLAAEWQREVKKLDFSEVTAPGFYYFQKNTRSGLNRNETAPVALKHFPTPTYSFSYFVDWLVYVPRGPLFTLTGRFCRFSRKRKFWYTFLWLLEYLSKKPLYGCTMCGDCTLYACGFLCYQAGCPKKQLNGPCGGSIDGYCEVHPERKRCFWVRAYHNLKGVRQHVSYMAPPIPARDISLERTSSWVNFFTGKDHRKMDFDKIRE